jgi:hypothetical protein
LQAREPMQVAEAQELAAAEAEEEEEEAWQK